MPNDTFPVLIKNNDKTYRLMNVSIGDDNSFYFTFPNSSNYKMVTYTKHNYSKANYSKHTIEFNASDFEYKLPKISFHPRNFTMHIKSQSTNKTIDTDYDLYNANKDGYFECPFMQILLPYDLDFFDEYNKTKYPITYTIERANHRKNLSIFVLIHSVEIVPPKMLPILSKNPNLLNATAIINDKYTLSFYTSYLPRNKDNQLLININTKYCAIITILEKEENSINA